MSSTIEPDAGRQAVAVVGATGFVGRSVVAHLQRRALPVRAISRDGRRLDGWGSSVTPLRGDVETGEGLAAALLGADAVVHLAAIPRRSRGRAIENVNVQGVARMLAAARSGGVRRIVHLSALGVADDPALDFLSSKWRGEQLVRESGLEWVVLRPSLLFGEGDGFFNLIKTTLTWWSPGVVAIPGDGSARFQPLSVEDLAIAVGQCLQQPDRTGKIYELGGPAYLSYREIVDAVMAATGKRRLKLNIPIPLIRALTAVTDRVLPIFPVTRDQIGSLRRPNYADLGGFEAAFGFAPRPLDLSYLR